MIQNHYITSQPWYSNDSQLLDLQTFLDRISFILYIGQLAGHLNIP